MVFLVKMEIHISATVRADKQAREHIALTVLLSTLANLAALLLNLFPCCAVDDWLVNIKKDCHVFFVILNSLFELVGLGITLEVDYIFYINPPVSPADFWLTEKVTEN